MERRPAKALAEAELANAIRDVVGTLGAKVWYCVILSRRDWVVTPAELEDVARRMLALCQAFKALR